jgi:exosome complex RNA-binding protein Rrp42 (RNase PH superfamily)
MGTPLSAGEVKQVIDAVTTCLRSDGRSPDAYRSIYVDPDTFKHAHGSCTVVRGGTRLIAAVRVIPGIPSVVAPNLGLLDVHVTFSSMADPSLSLLGSHANQILQARSRHVASILDSLLRVCLPLDQLVIVPGEHVYRVVLDVDVACVDGDVVEVASVAAFVALARTQYDVFEPAPDAEVDPLALNAGATIVDAANPTSTGADADAVTAEDLDVDQPPTSLQRARDANGDPVRASLPEESVALLPVIVTLARIGGCPTVADPTTEELAAAGALLHVAVAPISVAAGQHFASAVRALPPGSKRSAAAGVPDAAASFAVAGIYPSCLEAFVPPSALSAAGKPQVRVDLAGSVSPFFQAAGCLRPSELPCVLEAAVTRGALSLCHLRELLTQ